MLLNAFTRALRDPFTPARTAGPMALTATTSYYDPAEIASRVLPSVRTRRRPREGLHASRTFACVDTFLDLLKTHSKRLEKGPEAAAAALAADKDRDRAKAKAKPGGNVLTWAVHEAARRMGRRFIDLEPGVLTGERPDAEAGHG